MSNRTPGFERRTATDAMRVLQRSQLLFVAPLLFLVVASPTEAKLMVFEGTLSFLTIVPGPEPTTIVGTGVATVNEGGTDLALNTLRLSGGIDGTAVVPVTDPEVTATISGIFLEAHLGAGVLRPFSTVQPSGLLLTQNILPLVGQARVCLVVAGCGATTEIFPFQKGAFGIGVGGVWSGGPHANRVSVQGAPWTVGTAILSFVTAEGNTATVPEFGAAHGPLSLTGSTALTGGEIQLITPVLVTSGLAISPFTGFAKTTIRFVPEPEPVLLVGSGALALVLIGRKRIKPRRIQ